MGKSKLLLLAGLMAAAPGCDAQPITVLDVKIEVDDTGWSEEPFSLAGPMTLTFHIKVIEGNTVDVRVGPKGDPTTYKRDVSGDQLRERTATIVMERGDYVVRAKESSPRNPTGADRATLSLSIKGKPARILRK